jgi:hypothetical protein
VAWAENGKRFKNGTNQRLASILLFKGTMHRPELAESFDIDDNNLEHLSPQEAFALGVEWAIFFKRLKSNEPIRDFCLANNSHRLEKLAERMGRSSECRSTSAPNWAEIWIGAARS